MIDALFMYKLYSMRKGLLERTQENKFREVGRTPNLVSFLLSALGFRGSEEGITQESSRVLLASSPQHAIAIEKSGGIRR